MHFLLVLYGRMATLVFVSHTNIESHVLDLKCAKCLYTYLCSGMVSSRHGCVVGGREAGIVVGCLLVVIAVVAVISLVVKRRLQAHTQPTEELHMQNVLSTPAATADVNAGYDQSSNA